MRALESRRVILHCSATTPEMDIGVDWIRELHVHGNGWSDVGYHYVIKQDGTVEQGRPLHRAGAHTKGYNNSVGICYVGGVDNNHQPKDTMTWEQELSFFQLWHSLVTLFGPLTLHGHNEFANKACPSFDVRTKYRFLTNSNDTERHD